MTLRASTDVDEVSHSEMLGTSKKSDAYVTKNPVRFYVLYLTIA